MCSLEHGNNEGEIGHVPARGGGGGAWPHQLQVEPVGLQDVCCGHWDIALKILEQDEVEPRRQENAD